MAIAALIEFPGGTTQQYDAIIKDLNLGGKLAPGGIYHVAGVSDGTLRVVDVWESQQVFDKFAKERLGPIMQKHNIKPPQVKIWPVHNTLTK